MVTGRCAGVVLYVLGIVGLALMLTAIYMVLPGARWRSVTRPMAGGGRRRRRCGGAHQGSARTASQGIARRADHEEDERLRGQRLHEPAGMEQ